ncbi:MAG: hypothetical protein K2Y21_10205 [Phycisphaerales bacterium]|nr:hypothetical protein [Phycisphaerales bacterium]
MLALVTGCGGTSKAPAVPVASPLTAAAQGLEIRQWPVDDATDSIARALSAYESAEGALDDRTRERLRRCGLRSVVVPIADLPGIQQSLKLAGRMEQQEARQFTEWTPVTSGPAWRGLATFTGDRGALALPAGRLALFVRSWIAPGEFSQSETPAKLRLDLMTRHLEDGSERPTFEDLLKPQPRRVLSEAGARIDSLDVSTELGADQALLLVPEYPDREWAELARLPNYIEKEPEQRLEVEGKAVDPTAGPKVPPTPTLAHGLLSDANERGEPKRKLVLVLVARPPREFRLLR